MGIQWRRDDGVDLCRGHVVPGGRILDLGCGCGHASLALAQLGFQLHGIDFSPGMIDQAQRNAQEGALSATCRFEVRDVLDPELRGPFDGLVGLGFVEYFDDPAALLRHLHGLLVPGGVAVLQVWNRRPLADVVLTPLNRVVGSVGGLFRRSGKAATAQTPPDVQHRRYTPDEVHRLAAQADFEVVDARGSLFFPHDFFVAEGIRCRWDLGLRALGRRLPWVRRLAVNYLVALRAR